MKKLIFSRVREVCSHKQPRYWKTRLFLLYFFAALFTLLIKSAFPAVSQPANPAVSQCNPTIDRTVIIEPVYESGFTIANTLHVSVSFRLFENIE